MRPIMRPLVIAPLLALCSLTAVEAGPHGVPLNDYTRLGQRFTLMRPLIGISVVVPSWLDAEGGLALTLWDAPQRTKRLAEQAFTDVPDNAQVQLLLTKPLPAGSYYWEVHDRTGKTNVGLYGDTLEPESDDCAYFDGKPDRKQRFVFSPTPAAFAFGHSAALTATLKSEAPLADRVDACRQLAVVGDRAATPVLAGLLADEKLSHLARGALQAMPDPAAAAALREALPRLKGALLVGVINSLGERRDAAAVGPLAQRLHDPDPAVASAAAVALGKIGTLAAAKALVSALDGAPVGVLPALHESSLNCAGRLAAQGATDQAAAIYDRLRGPQTPAAVRAAATRGAIVARGARGVGLLLEQLRGDDADMANVALWVFQHELAGPQITQTVAAELAKLPTEKQLLLTRALCARGDPAALPALLGVVRNGEKSLRLAAISGLPRIPGDPVATALTDTLSDPDDEIAAAAQAALGHLRSRQADAALIAMLGSADRKARLRVIQLLGVRRATSAAPLLLQAAREADPEVRLAALKTLAELAGPAEIPALLESLAKAAAPEDLEATERALGAAFGRSGNPDSCAEKLIALLPEARPGLKQAVLRLLQSLGGSKACQAVLAAATDADPEVRGAAFGLLGEWQTAEVVPDLLRLAQTAAEPTDRLLCLRSYLRLAGNKDVPVDQRLAMCRQAGPLIQRPEEKKLLLGVLGGIPAPDALSLVTPYLADPATQQEASAAVLAIAEQLAQGSDAAKALEPLQKVAQTASGADLARRAEALLAKIRDKGTGK